MAGCSAVFHLAAYVHLGARTPAEIRRTHEVNHVATARLAEAARRLGVTLVFASTVSVFGAEAGALGVNEDAEPNPSNDYARSKLLAEQEIREEGTRGLRWVILRFPLLYGAGGRGNMERMLQAILHRRYWPIDDTTTRKSCLHFADASRALRLSSASPLAENRTFVVAPPRAATLNEIHSEAYRAAGRLKPPPVPLGLVRRAAGIVSWAAPKLGAQLETLTRPAYYDGARFAAATGFEPHISLRDGLAETAEWLKPQAK
jgi:UDP-glucose 4-epimerase